MKRFDIYALIFSLIGFLIMIVFVILLIPEHLNFGCSVSLEKASQIGDFIGGIVGVFFSIAAFLLLYETLCVQKNEISQTKKELQRQSFENNLFQMIHMHNEFVREFDIQVKRVKSMSNEIKTNDVITEGRDSFRYIYKNVLSQNILKSKIEDRAYIQSVFINVTRKSDDDLNHYFKHSLEIIRYIKDSIPICITDKDGKRYSSIFNSGLSTSEEVLLFYYVVFKGNAKDKEAINTLGFFDNLIPENLLHINHKEWL